MALHYRGIFDYFFIRKFFNFTQTPLDYIVILISTLLENSPMLSEWFILTLIIAVACCSILFGQTYTCYIQLYATISTIISLTIYTRLVFQLYHINFVSYLSCPFWHNSKQTILFATFSMLYFYYKYELFSQESPYKSTIKILF